MAPEASTKSAQASKEALDVISNRISIALAKHDNLVKSWTALSGRSEAWEQSQEELEAEDAALFRKQPSYLGVGAPIPSHFLVSDAERNNKSLRAKFFPTKGLKGSKLRDEEEKAASAKRGLVNESSDEEGGRSSLGKAKKRKRTDIPKEAEVKEKPTAKDEHVLAARMKNVNIVPEKPRPKEAADLGVSRHRVEAPPVPNEETAPTKSAEEIRREKKRQRKALKRKEKKNKNKGLTGSALGAVDDGTRITGLGI
jgi:hypothetical protein